MAEDTKGLAERGNEIFERLVRPQVDAEEDAQKYVAIDTGSEDFEVDRDALSAVDRLEERHSDVRGRIWLRRVGSRAAHHFGGRFLSDAFDYPTPMV
ncbi:hypothetical protein [Salinibacter sp.]|uniref:hypothetical protein n=1 Tax=Salinibacter sp. TaxID=2065818 RepID=UPI0021E8C1CB|nr:hypothetical protein [Salinibacter sp.]